MRSFFLSALILSSPVAAAAQGEPAPLDRQMEAALLALRPTTQVEGRDYPAKNLTDLMRGARVPGMSIAIIKDGRIAWARAYGQADSASGRPVTTETLFQAASISKPVAATAALKLVEQGKLELDQPVNLFLKSWKLPDGDAGKAEQVTLRRLLSHSAGLTVSGFPGYPASAPLPTLPQILDGVAPANTEAVRIDLAPASRFRYSGGGITVAQLMMTDASGENFPDLMERLVLRPLGMTHSHYEQPLEAGLRPQTAAGHDGKGAPLHGGHHVYPEMAAAGLWSTPSDLARWAIALSASFSSASGGLLKSEMAAEMLKGGAGDWGLGIGVDGEGEWLRVSHSGSNEGYRAMLIAFPRRGEGVVVMTNGENGGAVLGPIVQAIGRHFGWPHAEPRLIRRADVRIEDLRAVTGRYGNAEFNVTVSLAGDTLNLAVGAGPGFEIIAQGEDAFIAPQNGMRFKFERDAEGRVVSITGGGRTLPRLS